MSNSLKRRLSSKAKGAANEATLDAFYAADPARENWTYRQVQEATGVGHTTIGNYWQKRAARAESVSRLASRCPGSLSRPAGPPLTEISGLHPVVVAGRSEGGSVIRDSGTTNNLPAFDARIESPQDVTAAVAAFAAGLMEWAKSYIQAVRDGGDDREVDRAEIGMSVVREVLHSAADKFKHVEFIICINPVRDRKPPDEADDY